jgi:kynureninase
MFDKKFTMSQAFSIETARKFDEQDELSSFRNRFLIPQLNNQDSIYLCGNSLGLQPKSVAESIQIELDDWANLGVEGHVHSRRPWLNYHEMFAGPLGRLIGAQENEVVAMNGLTINLHLLLISFYRPTQQRFRIICEEKAFPSDVFVLQSQANLHGRSAGDVIREIKPRPGRVKIEEEDILAAIKEEGDALALVMIGGVNYYSGQVFDMNRITEAAHSVGAFAGFDLAHAIGNIELNLHEWNVDFAAWCSYKYLNSGPGSVAGIYIHEKHASNPEVFRLKGWWGHDKDSRFKMEPHFVPIPTAESWQMSNAPVLSMAAHRASLDIFDEAGMHRLVSKSKNLTTYLFTLLEDILKRPQFEGMFSIITPEERGCQLSLLFHHSGKNMFDHLFKQGIIADWREPDVIRVAPIPLYNSFVDVFRFAEIISQFKFESHHE